MAESNWPSERWNEYPRPRIPPRPVLSVRAFGIGNLDRRYRSAFDGSGARRLTSGRAAMAWSLRSVGLVAGDEVLVPAFNCPAVVQPINWMGARPVYYRVDRNLGVDYPDLKKRITSRSRALLVIHYFGFPQDMDKVMSVAGEGIAVIEDCAHSEFSRYSGLPVGSIGAYAISSVPKIYAATDGGYVASRAKLLPKPSRGTLGFELKAFGDVVESANAYGRMRYLRPFATMKRIAKSMLTRSRTTTEQPTFATPGSSEGGSEFEPDWIDVRMSMTSRALVSLSSRRRIVETRRRHYLAFHQALCALPGCRPVFETFPDGVVPYAYPLVVYDEQSVFPRLKHAGVPIFRWELANRDACPTSASYARDLLQFPCHQELTNMEVAWMIDEIRRAVVA